MKVALLTGLLLTMLFAGCISTSDAEDPRVPKQPELDYEPTDIRVTGTSQETLNIASFDGTELSTIIYAPLTQDSLPDGSEPPFPVVVFMHAWAFPKEMYEYHQGSPTEAPYSILETFAQQGFITVAYDSRGWGQSGGQTTASFTNEMKDFDAVLEYVNANFKTNGEVGVTGVSLGAGQAMKLWAENDNVTTVVPHNGWVDLYEGVVPGNVPKLEWFEFLYLAGVAGTGLQLGPEVHDWYQAAYTRNNLDDVRAAMDLRSTHDVVDSVTKPLFTCQGLQESLFPQSHMAWENAPGFVRAYYYAGGHNTRDGECWDRTLDWFLYFLQGQDNGVDNWPPIVSVDASGGEPMELKEWPETQDQVLYLRAPDFTEFPSNTSFEVAQQLVSNPLEEPSVIWDTLPAPRNAIPQQLRQDPTGVVFTSAPLTETQLLLGAPEVHLEGNVTPGFQVVGTLYHISEGMSRVLGYAAYAAIEEQHTEDVTLVFPWIKATMAPGDQYQLKLASNQPELYMPLLADYTVSFNGESTIVLPFVA
ncbi:MAG: CocE/NonD family hydrolase [Thermoplasmatota archaeon]